MTRSASLVVAAVAAAGLVGGCSAGSTAPKSVSPPVSPPVSQPTDGSPSAGGMLPGGGTISPRPGHFVPLEFRSACGHPGASVEVRKVPITVRHADCDLTGVTVSYKRHGGAVVGAKPGGVANSGSFSMVIHHRTLDVTIDSAKGPAGNA